MRLRNFVGLLLFAAVMMLLVAGMAVAAHKIHTAALEDLCGQPELDDAVDEFSEPVEYCGTRPRQAF